MEHFSREGLTLGDWTTHSKRGVSHRRACRVLDQARTTQLYRPAPKDEEKRPEKARQMTITHLFYPDCLAVLTGACPVPARKRFIWIVYSTFCLALGCSIGGARVHAPSLSPGSAAAKAMEEYDTNNDGRLDAQELDRCPALKNSLARFDKDSDGFLTAKEIADRLASYQKNDVGLIAVTCKVILDRRPLAGAHVTFVPESFLGSAFKPAKGVTDKTGKAVMKVEGANTPGVPCGLYRIEVSKQNASGRETLPAKYNSQSTLGEEVAPDLRSSGITLRLISR